MNPFMAGGFRKAAADIESVRTGQPPKYAKGGWTRFFETPFGTSDNEQEGLAWGGKQFGMAKTALNLMRPSAFVREGGSPADERSAPPSAAGGSRRGHRSELRSGRGGEEQGPPHHREARRGAHSGVKVLNVATMSSAKSPGADPLRPTKASWGPGLGPLQPTKRVAWEPWKARLGRGRSRRGPPGAFGKLAETLSPAYRAYKWLTGRKGSAPEAGGVPGAAAAHQTAKGGGGGGDMESMIQAAAEAMGSIRTCFGPRAPRVGLQPRAVGPDDPIRPKLRA